MATLGAGRYVLVAGGAGYIGSHTIVRLLESGYSVVVIDNLVNSCDESMKRVREITGCEEHRLKFYQQDLCDAVGLERVMAESPRFECCIHFAGLKAVGDSVREPLEYYRNNLDSTLVLLKLLDKYGCHSIVFSSSATVRGVPDRIVVILRLYFRQVYGAAPVPITEDTPTGNGITNAYGRTKYFIEQILAVSCVNRRIDISGVLWAALVTRNDFLLLKGFPPFH
jgi:UDP-glucose 4-epimerase